jgi:hypothetical protein
MVSQVSKLITPWGAPLRGTVSINTAFERGVLLYALRGSILGRRHGFKSRPPFPEAKAEVDGRLGESEQARPEARDDEGEGTLVR